MIKFLASIRKESLLLLRDVAGLGLLFIMPMALVLVITLIQNNILETTNQSNMELPVIDLDGSEFSADLQDGLAEAELFTLLKDEGGKAFAETGLRAAVARGDYQAAVIIRKGAGEALSGDIDAMLNGDKAENTDVVTLLFDPGIQHSLKFSVQAYVKQLLLAQKIRLLLQALQAQAEDAGGELDVSPDALFADEASGVAEEFASLGKASLKPNAVQHNVPGWTMFAIFFIALPLAASMLRERHEGTLMRLRTIPVSIAMVFSGKIAVYSLVSLVQLALMLSIGIWVLPLFGAPALTLGQHPEALLLVGIAAGLAATGLGILFGIVADNYDQVSVAGPIAIVIAAAIGGIMIPVFMMPDFMQPFSNFSPLHWGHEAFVDIFVRDAGVGTVWPNALLLLGFFAATLVAAVIVFRRQQP